MCILEAFKWNISIVKRVHRGSHVEIRCTTEKPCQNQICIHFMPHFPISTFLFQFIYVFLWIYGSVDFFFSSIFRLRLESPNSNSVCQMCLIQTIQMKNEHEMYQSFHRTIYSMCSEWQIKRDDSAESSAFCHINFDIKRLFVVLKSTSNDHKRTNHTKNHYNWMTLIWLPFLVHQNTCVNVTFNSLMFFCSVVVKQKTMKYHKNM